MGDLTERNVHIAEVHILTTTNIITIGFVIAAEIILDRTTVFYPEDAGNIERK